MCSLSVTTARNTLRKLNIPRTIRDPRSRLPFNRMTSAIHGDEEDYDPIKDSEYMKHCDQLGITQDMSGDTNKRHKITDIQTRTALEEVLKGFRNFLAS